MFAGIVAESAARRAVYHQRIQIGRIQQLQHRLAVRAFLERQNAKARQTRFTDGGVQIVMETRRLFAIEKAASARSSCCARTVSPLAAEVAVAAAEHAVHIAVQITLAGPHRRRVTQHHQQPHPQRQPAGQQVADQLIEQFDRRGFVAVHPADITIARR